LKKWKEKSPLKNLLNWGTHPVVDSAKGDQGEGIFGEKIRQKGKLRKNYRALRGKGEIRLIGKQPGPPHLGRLISN